MPARPDITILKDRFFEKPIQKLIFFLISLPKIMLSVLIRRTTGTSTVSCVSTTLFYGEIEKFLHDTTSYLELWNILAGISPTLMHI